MMCDADVRNRCNAIFWSPWCFSCIEKEIVCSVDALLSNCSFNDTQEIGQEEIDLTSWELQIECLLVFLLVTELCIQYQLEEMDSPSTVAVCRWCCLGICKLLGHNRA